MTNASNLALHNKQNHSASFMMHKTTFQTTSQMTDECGLPAFIKPQFDLHLAFWFRNWKTTGNYFNINKMINEAAQAGASERHREREREGCHWTFSYPNAQTLWMGFMCLHSAFGSSFNNTMRLVIGLPQADARSPFFFFSSPISRWFIYQCDSQRARNVRMLKQKHTLVGCYSVDR